MFQNLNILKKSKFHLEGSNVRRLDNCFSRKSISKIYLVENIDRIYSVEFYD